MSNVEKPTVHELEYLRIVNYLKKVSNREGKVASDDDYDLGVSAGKEELAKELLLVMYEKITDWNYEYE